MEVVLADHPLCHPGPTPWLPKELVLTHLTAHQPCLVRPVPTTATVVTAVASTVVMAATVAVVLATTEASEATEVSVVEEASTRQPILRIGER